MRFGHTARVTPASRTRSLVSAVAALATIQIAITAAFVAGTSR